MLFKGVGTALITPFKDYNIDFETAERLINMQIDAGTDAIVLSGTTGEAPTLDFDEKKKLFEFGREIIGGRVPMIAGTGTNNISEVIRLSEMAQKAGADGLLINNPYYNKSSDDGIIASYTAVSKEVDVPIIVYNVPSRTAKNITAEVALELCRIPHIEAFKEACGDISQIVEFMARKPEHIAVYSGNDDQTYSLLTLGGMGVICTCSNIIPERMCAITDAFFSGDTEASRKYQFEIIDLFKAIFCEANPIPLKTAMGLAGLAEEEMRLPLVPLKGAKLEMLKQALIRNGINIK